MDNNKNENFVELDNIELDAEVEELETEETGGFFADLRGRIEDFSDRLTEYSNEKYSKADVSSIISNKKAWTVFGSVTGAFLLLAVGLYFLLTCADLRTTGYSTKEFIDRFNSMAIIPSDSDIYEYYPSATDVFIPKGAKLGGKNVIEMYDGHVTIEADTSFGMIKKLYIRNIDIPGYDREKYEFSNCGEDLVLYFEILGKTAGVYGGGNPNISQVINAGIQLYQYAALYYQYGGDGTFQVDLGNNRATFKLEDHCLYVEPIDRKITHAEWPDWLKKKEKVVVPSAPNAEVSSADVSSTDVSNSDN